MCVDMRDIPVRMEYGETCRVPTKTHRLEREACVIRSRLIKYLALVSKHTTCIAVHVRKDGWSSTTHASDQVSQQAYH